MPGWVWSQVVDCRQQRASDGGREPGDAEHTGRLGGRVEVEPGGVDRSEDGDGVLGQAVAGGSEAHAAAVGLDERGADVAGECGDALGDARGGRAQLGGDLVHRAQPRELEQQPEPADVHPHIVSDLLNGMSSKVTWTRTVPGRFTTRHGSFHPLAPAPRWRSRRCSASSSAWPHPIGLIDDIGAGGRGLAPAVLGGRAAPGRPAAAALGVQPGNRSGRASLSASPPPA